MAKGGLGAVQLALNSKEVTLFDVFGGKPIAPFDITKKVWAYIKKNNLRVGYVYNGKAWVANNKKELVNA